MDFKVFGEVDENTLVQMRNALTVKGTAFGGLMADAHKGYAVPIGAVIGYKDHISPSGVGYDIACGNMAIRTTIKSEDIEPRIKTIMNDVAKNISFGMGRVNAEKVDHELFDDEAWQIPAIGALKQLAQNQLGTVGGGNHYVDVFEDEQQFVWIGVHFGSRGLGHKIASHYLKLGGAVDNMDSLPLVVSDNSDIGIEYLEGMRLAGRYAYAGREYVTLKVLELIGGTERDITDVVHNHHNYAWKEFHNGEEFWVVRKGATPAFPGQRGFVGGSMGDLSVILKGTERANESLFSTVHGAGRIMSRTQARGKFNRKTGERKTEGQISHQDMHEWLNKFGVYLVGADVDEAPQAYKRISDVIGYQIPTIEVIHALMPLGVVMAGAGDVDPYKD